jgi:hypothetical protein
LALLAAGGVIAAETPHGNFMGSGRACYGMLTITTRAIAWVTPFSLCRASPYVVIDRQDGSEGLRVTYRLQHPSANCRYPVLVLTHRVDAERDIGWSVAGYASLESAMGRNAGGELGCYLYHPSVGK